MLIFASRIDRMLIFASRIDRMLIFGSRIDRMLTFCPRAWGRSQGWPSPRKTKNCQTFFPNFVFSFFFNISSSYFLRII